MMSVDDQMIADYWAWFDTVPKRLYPIPPNGSYHMESLKEIDALLSAAREWESILTMELNSAQYAIERLEKEWQVTLAVGHTEADAKLLGEFNLYNGG